MTVIELIEKLKQMDADAPVMFSPIDIGWEPVEVLTVEDGQVILSMD